MRCCLGRAKEGYGMKEVGEVSFLVTFTGTYKGELVIFNSDNIENRR